MQPFRLFGLLSEIQQHILKFFCSNTATVEAYLNAASHDMRHSPKGTVWLAWEADLFGMVDH